MAHNYLTTRILTHNQKVCSLYKRALRNLESFHADRLESRFQCVMLRARFDATRAEKDLRISRQLYEDGERELFKSMHEQPYIPHDSYRGLLRDRYIPPPDWVLDYWHAYEKAQYPEYFARRELRKLEFVEKWEKEYGKPKPDELHH